jgi:small subunit ribosomal protein S11
MHGLKKNGVLKLTGTLLKNKMAKTPKKIFISLYEKQKLKLTKHKGSVVITSTFNNTVVVLMNLAGKVCAVLSAGTFRLKGTKKTLSLRDTSKRAGFLMGEKALKLKIKKVNVYFKGLGKGKRSVLTGLIGSGLKISCLQKINLLPHNGVKLKKKRRI